MKNLASIIFFLLFSFLLKGQDTIVLKSGTIIIATITDTSKAEIKYKKFAQPEPAGIYSVFKTDVLAIYYHDNKAVTYTANNDKDKIREERQFMGMRINFGMSANYLKRSKNDNLLDFWRFYNQNNDLTITNSKYYYSYHINMTLPIGVSKRNMLSSCGEVYFMPRGFINATNVLIDTFKLDTFNNEISLGGWGMVISMTYGHSLNHKKTFFTIFEAGIEPGFMNGDIKIQNHNYKISGTSGIASHFATGFDWVISKRLFASARIGYRFMKIENNFQIPGISKYFILYTNNTDKEVVFVNYGGLYSSIRLCFSLYARQRISRN